MISMASVTSSVMSNSGLVSGDVDGHNAFVPVLCAEVQDVVGPLSQAVDATKNQASLNEKSRGFKKSIAPIINVGVSYKVR